MAASVEYRAIQHHCATLIETLSRTVDPAQFARRLQGKSMIPEDIVLVASEERVLTRSERMTRVIEAVLAQIKLKDTLFHIFMGLLKEVNLHLWDVINQYYSSSLELNIFKALANVSDWKKLGSHLNISSGKISQLEECGGDIEQCRKEVALEWLKEDKTASWEGLCQALELMGNETEVQAIKERYIFTQCPDAHDEVCDRPDVPSIQERDIAGQVHALEGRFGNLVFCVQSELSRNAMPMAKFRHSITHLPSTIRREHYQFIMEQIKNIRKAEDIEEVFMYFNLYWTYLEYSLLKYIIHYHSTVLSTELKEEMRWYENDIEIFKKCTTMEQLLKVGIGIGCIKREPPPHFSRVVMKLKGNPSDYTLEDIDGVRRKMCLEFNLPTFILMLESIDEGSIWITWRVPSSEAHCFRSISQSDMGLISTDLVYLECTGAGDSDTAPIETSSSTTGDGAIGGGTTGDGATEGGATGGSATGGNATGGDAARVSRDAAVTFTRRQSELLPMSEPGHTTPGAPASTMEPWEEPDSGPCRLRLNIPESTLLLPCTDTEEASQRMLRRVAMTSCLLPKTLGRNLALPESELQGVLYASRGDIGEDRYTVLLKWIQTNGQAATNGYLLEALFDGGDVRCAQTVCMEFLSKSVSRDAAVPLPRRRSDMVLDRYGSYSRTFTPALHSLHTTAIKAHPLVPAFIGIGSEDKQVPATSPAYHQGVINPTVTQTDGAVPQFVLGLPGTTDRVATLSNPSLPSKSSMALSPHVKGGDTDSPRGRGTALSVVGICPVEDEQFEVTDARLCPIAFGHQIHKSLLKMLNEGALARVDVEAVNQDLSAKLEYQDAATELKVRQLMRAWTDTRHTALRKSNAALKTDLDAYKEMLQLTRSYLQQFRMRVHDEVAPLETQLSQLELCDDSSCTGEEEPLLSEVVEKLRRDREELEAQVESLTSMHQTALEEMSSYELKEAMLISERERLKKEVDYSTSRMRELLIKVSTLDKHNQKRYDQLEQCTREQEARIVLLIAEVARLKDQVAMPLKPALQRCHSLPLIGARGFPSSVHPLLHWDARDGGFRGDNETDNVGSTLKKACSVKNISVTPARPGVSKCDSQEECIAEDVLAEKYPLETWFRSIHRVMSHYAKRLYKLHKDTQSLFKRIEQVR